MFDTSIGWRFTNKLFPKDTTYAMGETAENVAKKWGISRQAQDEFAYNSQLKYQKAHEAGKFNDEMIAIEPGLRASGTWTLRGDEWFFP